MEKRRLSPGRVERTAKFRKDAAEIRVAFSKEEAELIIWPAALFPATALFASPMVWKKNVGCFMWQSLAPKNIYILRILWPVVVGAIRYQVPVCFWEKSVRIC